jgi:hypothetical protein
MVTGRPSKYKKSYCKAIVDYFQSGSIKSFPTVSGFASSIDVSKDTIYTWSKIHPEFSDSLSRAQAYAENLLIQGGMTGSFNSNFCKFVGQNFFGLSEKTESVNTNTHVFPTGINISFVKSDTSTKE